MAYSWSGAGTAELLDEQGWLEIFSGLGTLIAEAVVPLLGTAAGREEHGRGEGGDRTLELDRRAEQVVLAELEKLCGAGERFSVLSEEAGLLEFGAPFPRVLLDPVDGSLNAQRGLPVVGTMLCLVAGPTLGEAQVGYVQNLVSGERWHTIRGGGVHRNGQRLRPFPAGNRDRIEVLGLESGPRNLLAAQALIERAGKVRLLGSMALSLAHTAAGGIDVHCSPITARCLDLAASALMIAEVGGLVTDLDGEPLARLPADLTGRSTILASASPELHQVARDLLRGGRD
ncbi:MAG: hypothetical protein M3Y62_00705 [Candidatus Dormibacteraeota bacterium]|nr:hypothetical protein [Candidatus Dormibacteraeota bacterium]